MGEALSIREARRLAIAAQGLGRPRPRRATRADVRRALAAVGTLQLDAINVLARTQQLVLFSRVGPYDPALLHELTGPRAPLFEYWGHAASLQPTDWHAWYRWRMASPFRESPTYTARIAAWRAEHRDYLAAILDEVRDRGPLPASQLDDPRPQSGEWWDRRSLGRRALELLFAYGEVAGWRTASFERVYDVPERAIPAEVLARPTPPVEEAHRALLLEAAGSLGVGTVADLADYPRIDQRRAKARVRELVEAGALVEVAVEGWRDRAYVRSDARPTRGRRATATVLSPFDSLIWFRARTSRLFGFDYRIEVYTPAAKRTYGYYVLPVLLDGALVARVDLKADRAGSALLVPGAHLEPGADERAVAPALAAELDQVRTWLGLDRVVVAGNGDLAPALTRALAGSFS